MSTLYGYTHDYMISACVKHDNTCLVDEVTSVYDTCIMHVYYIIQYSSDLVCCITLHMSNQFMVVTHVL